MPNFDAEVRQVTLDVELMAIPAYAEFVLLICCVTLDNLKHEVCKLVKFDLREHV